MNKRDANNISVLKGVEIIALVVEHGRRFPFIQWCSPQRRDLSRGASIRSVRLLKRVLSELASGDKADLHIKDLFSTGEGFPTLVDFVRHRESETEVKGEKPKVNLAKVNLERGMLSLLDLIQHERSEKRKSAKVSGKRLRISFWEPADDRVKLLGLVADRGEEGLKAIDRLRAKLLKESIEKGRWY